MHARACVRACVCACVRARARTHAHIHRGRRTKLRDYLCAMSGDPQLTIEVIFVAHKCTRVTCEPIDANIYRR